MSEPTRSFEMKHACVGAIIVDRGRVLLGLRAHSRTWLPGVWDFPGGHVRPGESRPAALVRELREELGIRVCTVGESPFESHVEQEIRLDVWVVTEWDGEIVNCAPHEHEELRWVQMNELSALPLAHPAYEPMLARAVAWANQNA